MARVEVLIVDDNASMRILLRTLLARIGYRVTEAQDGVEAIETLRKQSFDLVITDLVMPRADGFEVLRRTRERHPRIPVIMLTAEGSISECVGAMRAGAFNFLTKPFQPDDLEAVVRQALPARAEQAPSPRPRPGTLGGDGQSQVALIGESPALRQVLDIIERVSSRSSTVLITGESGTGKEVVARLLHGSSCRASLPLVAVNCGAIPENLIESELFGHAKGAFTGALEASPGKFVQADGGTLFLDEIAELPLSLQVKLLRVVQEREVTAVGDTRVRSVDVRIIAATNRNLEAMVREVTFRADLFYRLEVLPIALPPLRERREDIPLLARHFLETMNWRFERSVRLPEDALAVLTAYSWPGNVREMENLFERLVILNRGGTILVSDLPCRVRDESGHTVALVAAASERRDGIIDLHATVAGFEGSLIENAMRRSGGNKTRAAELLGLSRTTLSDKLKALTSKPGVA
ncbi:MAG: two component, sigma54 specific, transcriptional regulator, Fis family [Myxococcales bacterium]|nr:two component, sigma54 specific, transcriptional regulator, Fis family [Myxococcales bacterium]